MEVVAAAEVNENMGLDDAPVDDPNIGVVIEATEAVDDPNMGELVEVIEPVDDPNMDELVVEAAEPVDTPKEKPEEDDELNVEPNADLPGCQVESPNKLEVAPLLEMVVLAAEDEADVPSPKEVPELKTFVAELEGNMELPEENAVFPFNPNDGDDADDPNEVDWLRVEDANPLVVGGA